MGEKDLRGLSTYQRHISAWAVSFLFTQLSLREADEPSQLGLGRPPGSMPRSLQLMSSSSQASHPQSRAGGEPLSPASPLPRWAPASGCCIPCVPCQEYHGLDSSGGSAARAFAASRLPAMPRFPEELSCQAAPHGPSVLDLGPRVSALGRGLGNHLSIHPILT